MRLRDYVFVFFRGTGRGAMATILLAEAHPVTREGLKQIIAANRDMVVAAQCSSARDVLSEISKNVYDLLVLGTSLPGMDWLDTLKDVARQRPDLHVLVVSAIADEEDAMRAMKAGASGYLTTHGTPEEFSNALRRILSGGKYVSASVSERLAFYPSGDSARPLHELLSDRESQVMRLLASGKTVSEIAGDMSLSVKTISTYRSRLLEKLNLKNNVELARYYTQHVDTRTVKCSECGQDNPVVAKFCTQCGTALAMPGQLVRVESAPVSVASRLSVRSPSALWRTRWFIIVAGAGLMAALAILLWRAVLPPGQLELKYDDGTPEIEMHADSGGFLVHFSPPGVPFVVEKVRVYGATLPSNRTQFEVQIWDERRNVVYSASYPLSIFPGVRVESGFLVHVFAESAPRTGLLVGIDDSTWNLHSDLTAMRIDGDYQIREEWGYNKPAEGMADMWFADRNRVNWMIRAVGRQGGSFSSAGSAVPVSPKQSNVSAAPTTVPATTQPRPLPPPDAVMKGFTFADWKPLDAPPPQWGLYRSPGADRSLEALAATGTNWISLWVNVCQETIASTAISRAQPLTATISSSVVSSIWLTVLG